MLLVPYIFWNIILIIGIIELLISVKMIKAKIRAIFIASENYTTIITG